MPGRWSFLIRYIWPPSVIAKVMTLLREWRRSDIKDKAILAVFFIPAMACVVGLVIRIVHFVLFMLPSFILSLLGWLLLVSLFSGAGIFCYEKVIAKRVGHDQEPYDVTPGRDEAEKDKKNWFEDIKWFKK